MLKRLWLAGGVLALGVTSALAQANPAPPAAPGVPPPSNAARPADTPSGSNALAPTNQRAGQAATITLVQAIDTVEGQGQAKAISAEFEDDDGGQWEIKTVQADGKLVEHVIDARSGQIRKSENKPFEGFFTRLKPADFQNARTSLKQAVALAEQQAGGRAIEVEVERENNSVQYEVTVVNGDRSTEIKISADGQVVKE